MLVTLFSLDLQLSRLCERLDQLWEQYSGMPIISVWHDFLYNDAFEFLGKWMSYWADGTGATMKHQFVMVVGWSFKNK